MAISNLLPEYPTPEPDHSFGHIWGYNILIILTFVEGIGGTMYQTVPPFPTSSTKTAKP